ncbi:RING finger protein [Francisella sp. SYW-9]|uniref:RING finger protein n=1 Tax=Francisella sp. SYW-9 TaxID=2610888 RepID=UPI00123DF3B0|nr:RING finger protein [Francisella sp. SYW-9]
MECVICWNYIENYNFFSRKEQDQGLLENNIYRLQCGHFFHLNCIVESVINKPECPYCRAQTSLKEIEFFISQYFDSSGEYSVPTLLEDLISLYFNNLSKFFVSTDMESLTRNSIPITSFFISSTKVNITFKIDYNQRWSYECFRLLAGDSAPYQPYSVTSIDLSFSDETRPEHIQVIFCEDSEVIRNMVTLPRNSRTVFIVKNILRPFPNIGNVINDSSIRNSDELLGIIIWRLVKIELQDTITKSVEEYIRWSQNLSSISIFKHGENGKRRALALKILSDSSTSVKGVVNAIRSFFNNTITDERGNTIPGSINTNNHSFISFFLNELKYRKYLNKILLPDLELDIRTDYHNHSSDNKDKRNSAKLSLSQLPESMAIGIR